MIDPFGKMNANLELEMVWVFCFSQECHSIEIEYGLWRYVVWKCVVVLKVFCVIYSCLNICLVDVYYCNFAFINIVHSIVDFNYDFTLLLGAPDHPLLLLDLNVNCELSNQCQFCWWSMHCFFKDLGKLQSVVKSMSVLLVKHVPTSPLSPPLQYHQPKCPVELNLDHLPQYIDQHHFVQQQDHVQPPTGALEVGVTFDEKTQCIWAVKEYIKKSFWLQNNIFWLEKAKLRV